MNNKKNGFGGAFLIILLLVAMVGGVLGYKAYSEGSTDLIAASGIQDAINTGRDIIAGKQVELPEQKNPIANPEEILTASEPEQAVEPEATTEPEAAEPETTTEPEQAVQPEVTAEPEVATEPETPEEPALTAQADAETADPDDPADRNKDDKDQDDKTQNEDSDTEVIQDDVQIDSDALADYLVDNIDPEAVQDAEETEDKDSKTSKDDKKSDDKKSDSKKQTEDADAEDVDTEDVETADTEEDETSSSKKDSKSNKDSDKSDKDSKSDKDTKDDKTSKNSKTSKSGAAVLFTDYDFYGQLSVEDGQLVDEDGNEARLIGVSSLNLSWYPEFVTADSIESLRNNFGINVIRLSNYTSDYNGYCVGGSDNQDRLKDIIDEAVQAAIDNDMYVIIDWHNLNDSDPNEYKSEAIQFFGEMVRKYKNCDNVIYEICGDPNGDTSWEDISDYAEEVIPVIRNVDKEALILVGTPDYCSDLSGVIKSPLDYDNIMYTYHFYAGSDSDQAREDLEEALDAELPIFISQFDLVEEDGDGKVDEDEASQWFALMKEKNLSACAWHLTNKSQGAALIDEDCDSLIDIEYDDLSEQGKYIYDYLLSEED